MCVYEKCSVIRKVYRRNPNNMQFGVLHRVRLKQTASLLLMLFSTPPSIVEVQIWQSFFKCFYSSQILARVEYNVIYQ